MGQSVWHRDDIGRTCESVLAVALSANDEQSAEFLRGVAVGVLAVAHALGAPVQLPRQPVTVTLDAIARELTR